MGAKMTARLCAASILAGAVMAPPTLRLAKREAAKVARKTARGYVKARHRLTELAEATGRPGEFAGMAAAFAAQAAKDTAGRWWELVDDVQREEEMARKTHEAQPGTGTPPETIDDYMSKQANAPG